jgi:hypothetical protein
MRVHRPAAPAFVATLLVMSAASTASWAAPTVAVAKGKGPKKAALAQAASALKKELAGEGIEVVDAKVPKSGKLDVKLARAVGADFLVTVEASDAKKKFRLRAEVLRVEDGETIHSASSEPYSGKAEAAQAARELVPGILEVLKAATTPRVVEAPTPKPPPDPPPVARVTPRDEAGGRASEPGDPERSDEEPAAPRAASTEGGSAPWLQLRVGAGTQATSAYTVLVGGAPTALAYTLSPLFLIDVGLEVFIPSLPLVVEASFLMSPVTFALDTDPPVTPTEPGGSFLEVGGAVAWRLRLSGRDGDRAGFVLEPKVGLRLESLSVDPQTPTIVVGQSAVVPHLGVGAAWGLSEALVLGADVRLRLPLGYSESGATTGDGGSGFGLAFGGSARYWLAQAFGLTAGLTYTYTSVSFSGVGSRQRFASDPIIQDASVASSSLRVSVGALLAL